MRTSARLTAVCLVLLLGGSAFGDDPPAPTQRLIDRTPFDQLVLDAANENRTLDVLPLDLPERPFSAVPLEGTVQVRLLERPTELYEVSWADVARVRVFEELLLDEAVRLTADGKFDEAFDYLALLSKNHPALPGLAEAVGNYLRQDALALYQAGERDRALAVLVALRQHDPQFAGLAGALQTIAGEIIQRYLRDGNYSAARGVLEMWRSQFPDLATAAAGDWQRRFEAAATRQIDQARTLVQQRQFIAARKAVARARAIWPDLAAAAELQDEIKREFPFLTVGVFEAAPLRPGRTFDNWAAMRTQRLVQQLLVEQASFGAEGGVYRSTVGQLELDESGRQLTLTLEAGGATPSAPMARVAPDTLSRFLLSLAAPDSPLYRSDYAGLLGGVVLEPENRVRLEFVRAHVRPEPLLQHPLPEESGAAATSFTMAEHSPGQVVFEAVESPRRAALSFRAIVEHTQPDDESAAAALLAGGLDVLDRVPPWQVARLRAAPAVRVDAYGLPTVHVLIPNTKRALLASREFRRALDFAIDRRWIVERVLTGGTPMPGFVALSGPLPVGSSLSDPLRYGYNSQVAPRPFEPRLATVLATVAWAGMQPPNAEKSDELSPIPELVLAHPLDPLIRVACQSIETQLERIGIPVELRALSADELTADGDAWDLRYAELAVWEPVTDARRIVGREGLAGAACSPYLEAALRELDQATNWQDVRARLAAVHEIVHHELPVIALWQTVNHFAYRAMIDGIGASPLTLYQHVEDWRATDGNGVARN